MFVHFFSPCSFNSSSIIGDTLLGRNPSVNTFQLLTVQVRRPQDHKNPGWAWERPAKQGWAVEMCLWAAAPATPWSSVWLWPSFYDWLLYPNVPEGCLSISFLVWLSNIPVYGWTTFYSSVSQWVDISVVSTFRLLWIKGLWTSAYKFLCGCVFRSLRDKSRGRVAES